VVADIGMTRAPVHFLFARRRRAAGGTPTFNYKTGIPINPKRYLFSHIFIQITNTDTGPGGFGGIGTVKPALTMP
jgi:hypothetical protein